MWIECTMQKVYICKCFFCTFNEHIVKCYLKEYIKEIVPGWTRTTNLSVNSRTRYPIAPQRPRVPLKPKLPTFGKMEEFGMFLCGSGCILRPFVGLYVPWYSQDTFPFPFKWLEHYLVSLKKVSASPAGNRTPVSRVTGGDTHHYTTED